MKRYLFLSVMVLVMGCQVVTAQKSIVILYENDVHCGIDGYKKMAGLRDAINRTDTAYAAAVCVGDFLQGNTTGAISKGQYIVDIMKQMDYHALALGNHEFDYGVPRMKELMAQLDVPVVCANLYEAGEPEPMYAPYVIRQYGDKKVAFVGATTPETMILEGYSFYDTNGILLYDLKSENFYQLIQQAVDRARQEGADYVVVLSHVGETPQSMGFSSHLMVNNTRGIDVVLDGHSHEVIEDSTAVNLDGQKISVTQTGTQFANVGKLLITPDGRFITKLIKSADIPYENEAVAAVTDSIHKMVKAATSTVVAHTDYRLVVSDENDQWVVRNQETNAGDLVADAYRHAMKADIGFENGGGIRNDIMAGDITYGDIIGMLPYDNTLRRIAVTGQQLKEMLSRCTALVPVLDGNFPQCSGVRFIVHSKSHTVSDIEVLQSDGSYAPLELNHTYSVAVTDYNHQGGGLFECFKKCPVLFESSMRYYEALADYLKKELGASTGNAYAQPQGRIRIVED
ncbi:MAG: bifunctional metallophosphatase/5'-nucleotidase [Prevotella sp.]|nr:bifunctional metallophosphatase/5'-nucleotidase [Prevotella sp.]